MKKIVAILMAMMLVMSVTVVVADGVAATEEDQPEKVDQQIFKSKEINVLGEEEFVADEILVKFKPEVRAEKIDEINSKHGALVRYTSPYTGTKRIAIPKGKSVPEMVGIYSENPNVEYAEPNYIAYALMVPNDPLYNPYQWHLDNDLYGGINMKSAWDISTGTGVVVAVLDTGVAYENNEEFVDGPGRHDYWITYAQAPDLAGTIFVDGYDFVNDDGHPNDDEGHGTHVTGTIAQTTNNGLGVAGVAFNAEIMPVKVLDSRGSGTYEDIAAGIYFAANNGADVISMSLGGSSSSTTLENALDYAYTNNVTIVCSSGNDGSETTVSYPAAYDDYCIAVGATRYDENVTDYSNGGPSLDLTAPGGDLSVDQNGDGYGDGVLQQTHDGSDYTDFGYWFYSGTSMAAPHVSGVAALLISKGIATTPDEVRAVLQDTAEDKGPGGWDPAYGWGIVDAYAALQWTETPNNQPVADAGGPYSGTEDINLTFDGSGSDDLDGDLLTYAWNFGDGSTGTGVNPTHAYTAGGTYTVILVVNDGKENSIPSTTTANITEVNDPPVADAGPDQKALVGEVVTFDGSWSSDEEGAIDNYAWNFGDGSTGTGVNPTHTYAATGTYTVELTVTDNGGLTSTDSAIVTVTEEAADANMHVESIDMSTGSRNAGKNEFVWAVAKVTIFDTNDEPVDGATVYGTWSVATSDIDSGITDDIGQVSLKSDSVKNPSAGTTFTFTVDGVTHADLTWDEGSASGSIQVQ